jgi:predicted dienelactone hydrolase
MLLIALLLGCTPTDDLDSGHDTATDTGSSPHDLLAPDLAGPFAVGTFEDSVAGPDGLTLTVQVWFPASQPGAEAYAYNPEFSGLATEDATPDCSTPRPVLAFSHGNAGLRYHAAYLSERLASRGWVVVAPDHTHGTALDYDEAQLPEVLFRRPLDLAASFDGLVAGHGAPGGKLDGCVDASAGYAAAGHSIGGTSAAAVAGAVMDPVATAEHCAQRSGWLCDVVAAWAAAHPGAQLQQADDRVWAALLLAPAGYEALVGGLGDTEVPLLALGATDDSTAPFDHQVEPIFDAWSGLPRYLGELAGAGHHSFSDTCAMGLDYPECSEPYMAVDEAHGLISTLTAAFLGRAQGDERYDPWLPPEHGALSWDEVK